MNKILVLLVSLAILGFDIENDERMFFVDISPEDAYNGILNNLNPLYPGRGIDVFNEKELDRPMAYALILSAESNKFKFIQDPITLNRIRLCGEWLLKNSDLNNNGIHGYGLPDPWDAFGDKTENPANQEYTIDTAVAIKGLLDWYDIEPDRKKKKEIHESVYLTIEPFLMDNYNSPLGIPGYSFNSNDKEKDVFNPAVYLASQLKRFTKLKTRRALKTTLNAKSEKVFDVLFSYRQTDTNGNLYWNYGSYTEITNDLVHACYMAEGIRDYKSYGGDFNANWFQIMDHLSLFYSGNKWHRFFEKDRQIEKHSPKLWDLGMLMYSLSREGNYKTIDQKVWPQIQDFYMGNGHFRYRINDNRAMVAHYGHLLLGLSHYLYNEKSVTNKE